MDLAAPVPEHDAILAHALGEVLVWGADQDPLEVSRVAAARCGEGVVGFELLHLPERQPEGFDGLLGQGELLPEVRGQPLASLVASEEIVAEGLDDVVRRAGHVGHARLAEELEQDRDQAADRRDLLVPGAPARGDRGVGPKELVGRVDEVEVWHGSACGREVEV